MPAILFDALSLASMRLFANIARRPSRIKYRVYVSGGGILEGLVANAIANWIMEPIIRYAVWVVGCWAFSGGALVLYTSGLIGRNLSRSASWGFGESHTFSAGGRYNRYPTSRGTGRRSTVARTHFSGPS